jgi:hypothetical protein
MHVLHVLLHPPVVGSRRVGGTLLGHAIAAAGHRARSSPIGRKLLLRGGWNGRGVVVAQVVPDMAIESR